MKITLGSQNNRRTSMSRIIWGFLIFAILVIILIWSGFGNFTYQNKAIAATTTAKITLTIGLIVILLIGYFSLAYQRKKDAAIQSGEYTPSTADKVLETTYKVSGVYSRIRAIGGIVGTILALCISLYFLFKGFTTPQGTAYFVFSLIMLLVGLGAGINSWIYWKRSKPLTRGRFY